MSKIIKEDPSWVTKYNGFNNGKDASDGVGGKRIPLQIKTMSKTKEEILKEAHAKDYPCSLMGKNVMEAMDEYAAQVLSEYKEKLKAMCSYLKLKDEEEACNGAWNQAIQTIIEKL